MNDYLFIIWKLIQNEFYGHAFYFLKTLLHPMDAINQRYPRKRALYLAGLVQHLMSTKTVGSLSYSCLHGNRLRPLLLIKPRGMIGVIKAFTEIKYHSNF